MQSLIEGAYPPRKKERWIRFGPITKERFRRNFRDEAANAAPVEGILVSVPRARALESTFKLVGAALDQSALAPHYYTLRRFGANPQAYDIMSSPSLYVDFDSDGLKKAPDQVVIVFARNTFGTNENYQAARDQFIAHVNAHLTNIGQRPLLTFPKDPSLVRTIE